MTGFERPGLYNADCMDGMKAFPDKYFDLAIVDPPYGSGGGSFAAGTRFGGRFDRYRSKNEGGDTSPADCGRGNVHRTGGAGPAKFAKKSSRGTLRRGKIISMSFSASHGARLSGAQTISKCRRRETSSYGKRRRLLKHFQWRWRNMLGYPLMAIPKSGGVPRSVKKTGSTRRKSRLNYTRGCSGFMQNRGTKSSTPTPGAGAALWPVSGRAMTAGDLRSTLSIIKRPLNGLNVSGIKSTCFGTCKGGRG